ncbi:hypothetical protein NQ176_g10089 [Zarea fungicola]|uniref:Uncharacterized protein n=1 Tax=Zarea fungicola TaxID=93591 RepID=A0ACC1MJX2_9HYPO|nr:hypothetical protein NQ176_g10089 [Lecanicillium fungicola]
MSEQLRVWLEPKRHSVEGHTATCILTFRGRTIWGPASCHQNTIELRNAIHKADDRFNILFEPKSHTVEGHTRSISVSSFGQVLLDRLSTHDNMEGLVIAINAVLAIDPLIAETHNSKL